VCTHRLLVLRLVQRQRLALLHECLPESERVSVPEDRERGGDRAAPVPVALGVLR
jgi:hypothetical protein